MTGSSKQMTELIKQNAIANYLTAKEDLANRVITEEEFEIIVESMPLSLRKAFRKNIEIDNSVKTSIDRFLDEH